MTTKLHTVRILSFILFFIGIGLFLAGSTIAAAAENDTKVQLLANGDFEQSASEWTPVNASPTGINGRSGTGISWDAKGLSLVYQQVPVIPGTTLRLSAWTQSNANSNIWVRQRVGIDPTGNTDPNSPAVQWSLPGQFLNSWGQLVVESKADSETVTVFLASNPDSGNATVSYDDATLYSVAFPVQQANPMPAPTTDPLIVGLVQGSGVAPGTQGYKANLSTEDKDSDSFGIIAVSIITIFLLMAIIVSHVQYVRNLPQTKKAEEQSTSDN